MITIHLHNLKFYGYHGVHDQEKILGNEYEINADVQFHEEHQMINSISETIDYSNLYEIIKQRMIVPTQLLETIIIDIGNTIHDRYNYVRSIKISLKKVHPPIATLQGSAGVTWHKEF